jgi:hypothetical protein
MKASQRRGSFKRKMGIGVATAVCFVGLGTTPVAADAPIEFDDGDTFTDVNPCTGGDMMVTINVDVKVHEHRNNFVAHVSKTGSTDDGYIMNHGSESQVGNKNVFRASFTDNWTNADGSKFKAQGTFVVDIETDTVRVDRFRLRCVGN